MMRPAAILLTFLLCLSPAFGQQQPDAAFLQRAIAAMQAQRNAALDAAAVAEARAGQLADDITKANVRIKELEQPRPDAGLK